MTYFPWYHLNLIDKTNFNNSLFFLTQSNADYLNNIVRSNNQLQGDNK